MDEKKPKKKIERADMFKSFDLMEKMAGNNQEVKENMQKAREKMGEYLNQFETPEFKEKLTRMAQVGTEMKQERNLTKESVKAMSLEERQALARELMERMGLPIPEKLKKKDENKN